MNNLPTPPPSGLPSLSDATVETLKTLRATDARAFLQYVRSLRANKWPHRAIAEALGVSRTASLNWEKAASVSDPLIATESFPESPPKRVRTPRHKYTFTDKQVKELRHLAHEASKVRRFTDAGAESRKAATKLEKLLQHYTQAGASLGQLAGHCQVSRSSIAQRLRKYQD
jgi:DNA-binding XRE family transcriptional regulator